MSICPYYNSNRQIDTIYKIVKDLNKSDMCTTVYNTVITLGLYWPCYTNNAHSLTYQITKRGLMPILTEALINNKQRITE